MAKLPKAPLQEAIFEIRWELEIEPATNQQSDIGFPLAQGKLQSIVKDRFPIFQRKIPVGFPDQLFHYQIVNQYWSGSEKWPVLQLGPGIFTVNDTDDNYDWPKTYFPLVKQALEWIYLAYDGKLKTNNATLRYIDSVKIKDYGYEEKWQDFVKDNFNFSFENHFDSRGSLRKLQFDQYFEMPDQSSLHISMNSGKYRKSDDQALIWQTAVTRNNRFEKDSLILWLEQAHAVTSDLFREMTKPKFYASFQ